MSCLHLGHHYSGDEYAVEHALTRLKQNGRRRSQDLLGRQTVKSALSGAEGDSHTGKGNKPRLPEAKLECIPDKKARGPVTAAAAPRILVPIKKGNQSSDLSSVLETKQLLLSSEDGNLQAINVKINWSLPAKKLKSSKSREGARTGLHQDAAPGSLQHSR